MTRLREGYLPLQGDRSAALQVRTVRITGIHGDAFRKAIADCGLTFAELARRIGVLKPAVSQWASGDRPIPFDHALAVAEVVGKDIESFCDVQVQR